MQANRVSEGLALDIPTLAHEIFDLVAMTDRGHALGDDRPGIQLGGDVMSGGADELHAALVRSQIGASTSEGRKEGMMDIDHATGPALGDLGGQNPHVPGQHNEFR